MRNSRILMAHGSGGRKSQELLRDIFLRHLGNEYLDVLGDSAILDAGPGRLAFTTDAFVVKPLFFPGGDIGRLAVCGSVNDLAAAGAEPVALSAAFILEEGLETEVLERIVLSMREAADSVGVSVVAGDTKVVPRGAADGMYITTSGAGVIREGVEPPMPSRAEKGDAVILSGTVADHGMAVMTRREGIKIESEIVSDCAPLWEMVASVMKAAPGVHAMRDPTRGGLAAALNEIAESSGVCIEVDEDRIMVGEGVRTACELLGIDPLHVANEGKMVVILPEREADAAVAAMRGLPVGRDASIIGTVKAEPAGRVHIKTTLGSLRILDVPTGDILPRIC